MSAHKLLEKRMEPNVMGEYPSPVLLRFCEANALMEEWDAMRSRPASETPVGDVRVIVVNNDGNVHRWRMVNTTQEDWEMICKQNEILYWFYDPGAPEEARS